MDSSQRMELLPQGGKSLTESSSGAPAPGCPMDSGEGEAITGPSPAGESRRDVEKSLKERRKGEREEEKGRGLEGEKRDEVEKKTEDEEVIETEGEGNEPEDRGETETDVHEMMDMIGEIVNEMYMKGRFKKELVEKHRNVMTRIAKEVRKLEIENAEMRGRVNERGKIMEELVSKIREGEGLVTAPKAEIAFAEIVKEEQIKSRKENEERRQRTEVVISKEGEDPEEVRRGLLKVNPRELKVNIDKIIKTKRGVILEVGSKKEAEIIKKNEILKDKGYEIKDARRKNPMVIIYDLESKEKEEEIWKEVFERNLKGIGLKEEDFLKSVKVRRKIKNYTYVKRGEKKSSGKENWIVEVESKSFNEMIRRERLYLGWETKKVREYIDIVKCYKCQGYGHIAKVCTGVVTCAHCAEDHKTQECTNKDQEPVCANCRREDRRDDHNVNYSRCGVYEKMLSRYRNIVNYEI